jgi:plastocyanin
MFLGVMKSMSKIKFYRILLALTSLVFLNQLDANAADHAVVQKAKAFSESVIEVSKGDKVVIKNEDDTAHHIMFKWGGKTISQKQEPGDTPFSFQFDEPGETVVRCAIHPKMVLNIKVK